MASQPVRIGIDLGGTKIAGIAFGPDDQVLAEWRRASPRDDYAASITALVEVVKHLENEIGSEGTVGVGMPGSLSPITGLVQNSNSVWLNGRALAQDFEGALGRPARFANDANCFALSEAADGAGAGARSVFGAILGTGCGGGFVFEGKIVDGPNRSGSEWGHAPLPWPEPDEYPGPTCWCGRKGCMEMWLSGTGLTRDHAERSGETRPATEIAESVATDSAARESVERHLSRVARGMAMIVNLFDPEVIVIGGGLSKMRHLYERLPDMIGPLVFADPGRVTVRPPRHGDASGVRGAARLWDDV